MLLLADVAPEFSPFGLLVLLGCYFLPAFYGRKQPNYWTVLLVNTMLGWTFIGWLYALNLALEPTPADREAVVAFRSKRSPNNLLS
ncbi:superinfection immunity protein [Hymenobacter chitinivorans]|uniref:superinfection immunity protein n=1 Tax=Hymenobacter chitinivorans TaxID=89969 RepID=UPI0037441648